MNRLIKIVVWLYVGFGLFWLGALVVSAFCHVTAFQHGELVPNASIGHTDPFVTGKRGGPYHTYYVSSLFAAAGNIADFVTIWGMVVAFCCGSLAAIYNWYRKRFRGGGQISN
jgi:hypothetical protein